MIYYILKYTAKVIYLKQINFVKGSKVVINYYIEYQLVIVGISKTSNIYYYLIKYHHN